MLGSSCSSSACYGRRDCSTPSRMARRRACRIVFEAGEGHGRETMPRHGLGVYGEQRAASTPACFSQERWDRAIGAPVPSSLNTLRNKRSYIGPGELLWFQFKLLSYEFVLFAKFLVDSKGVFEVVMLGKAMATTARSPSDSCQPETPAKEMITLVNSVQVLSKKKRGSDGFVAATSNSVVVINAV
ncbi:hypothetical protein EJB05_41318, partial [Eragrostis curvula]